MSENPTIPQLLQRLAVVAPEWISFKHDTGHVTVKIDGFMHLENYCIAIGGWTKQQLSLLFGAACEKIEAEGWQYALLCNWSPEGLEYVFDITSLDLDPKITKEHPTNAALQALLAALEGREEECKLCEDGVLVDYETGLNRPCPYCRPVIRRKEGCPHCEGLQVGIKEEYLCKHCQGSGYENPLLNQSNIECPECNGGNHWDRQNEEMITCPKCDGDGKTWNGKSPNANASSELFKDCPACQCSGKKQEVNA